jgi:hypothetical protein
VFDLPGPPDHPWEPVLFTEPVVHTLKAWGRGEASAEQQALLLNWIVYSLSGLHHASYSPRSDRDTAFAEGKRHVGLELMRVLKAPVDLLKPVAVKLKRHDDGSQYGG